MKEGCPEVGDVLMHSNRLICLIVREHADKEGKRMVEVLWLDEPDDNEGENWDKVSSHYGYEVNWRGWVLL